MGDNSRPTAVNAAAFCLPQHAPLSATELLPQAQQKPDRIRLTAAALCVCQVLLLSTREEVLGTRIFWNWAGPSWFTITACPSQRNAKLEATLGDSLFQGLARILWQGYRCFDNLTSWSIHEPPINKFLEIYQIKFHCCVVQLDRFPVI